MTSAEREVQRPSDVAGHAIIGFVCSLVVWIISPVHRNKLDWGDRYTVAQIYVRCCCIGRFLLDLGVEQLQERNS